MNRDAAIEAGVKAVEAVVLDEVGPCSCDSAYSRRGLVDPDCEWHIAAQVSPVAVATAVLDAVVPAIQAQALRDAAEAVVPRASEHPELVGLIQRNRGAASVFAYAAVKLVQRATRIERGELP